MSTNKIYLTEKKNSNIDSNDLRDNRWEDEEVKETTKKRESYSSLKSMMRKGFI